MSNMLDEPPLWYAWSGFVKGFLTESMLVAAKEAFSKGLGHFSASLRGERDFSAPTILFFFKWGS